MNDTKDIVLDPVQAARIIRGQFPDVMASEVLMLGEGCDSRTFAVDGRWVFRFPKRADVAAQLAIEARILPVLAASSPVPLPVFRYHGEPADGYPHRFAGYPILEGRLAHELEAAAMPPGSWAPAMGRFLSWLHRFPPEEARRHGVRIENLAPLLDEVREDALGDFHLLSRVTKTAPLVRWRAFFEAPPPQVPPDLVPALTHRDLAAEHILFDPERQAVTGIIDWSEIAISDRAADLACFYHWGGTPYVEAVLAAYDLPVGEGLLARARYLAACRGVADVDFGLANGRNEFIGPGIRALELCIGNSG